MTDDLKWEVYKLRHVYTGFCTLLLSFGLYVFFLTPLTFCTALINGHVIIPEVFLFERYILGNALFIWALYFARVAYKCDRALVMGDEESLQQVKEAYGKKPFKFDPQELQNLNKGFYEEQKTKDLV